MYSKKCGQYICCASICCNIETLVGWMAGSLEAEPSAAAGAWRECSDSRAAAAATRGGCSCRPWRPTPRKCSVENRRSLSWELLSFEGAFQRPGRHPENKKTQKRESQLSFCTPCTLKHFQTHSGLRIPLDHNYAILWQSSWRWMPWQMMVSHGALAAHSKQWLKWSEKIRILLQESSFNRVLRFFLEDFDFDCFLGVISYNLTQCWTGGRKESCAATTLLLGFWIRMDVVCTRAWSSPQ